MSDIKQVAVGILAAVSLTLFCSGLLGLAVAIVRFGWRLAG